MAWCLQAISHYLSKCWPRSKSPYHITRPYWVNQGCIYIWISHTKHCGLYNGNDKQQAQSMDRQTDHNITIQPRVSEGKNWWWSIADHILVSRSHGKLPSISHPCPYSNNGLTGTPIRPMSCIWYMENYLGFSPILSLIWSALGNKHHNKLLWTASHAIRDLHQPMTCFAEIGTFNWHN